MNVPKLKAKMILENKSVDNVLEALGISRSAWFRKTTGASEFTQSEISSMRVLLNLDDHETAEIFFEEEVS